MLSYIIIGSLSIGLNFLSFAFFWNFLGINYKISVTIAYIITVVFNFSCNRHFTFRSSGANFVSHAYRYIAMIFLNYSITMITVHIVVEGFGLSPYFGLLSSVAVTSITGFTLSKFWVYKHKSDVKRDAVNSKIGSE